MGYTMKIMQNYTSALNQPKAYPLYPHEFGDLVFLIYQYGKLTDRPPRSSAKAISLWFALTLSTTLILFAIRTIANCSNRRTRHTRENFESDYLVGSFVDTMAVFLGVALNTIGNNRADRWFLISLSIFGLFFKMIQTDSLFVMYTAPNQNRITSIDQLYRTGLTIYADPSAANLHGVYYLRIKS